MKENNFDSTKREFDLPEFEKYGKIPYLESFPQIQGKRGYIFEKIDGSQCQVRNFDGRVVGGTKSNYLVGQTTKRSSWIPDFLGWMYNNESLFNLPNDIVLFGEWLEPVSVRGYKKRNIGQFYFIDLGFRDSDELSFFDYDEAVNYLGSWGVSNVRTPEPLRRETVFNENLIKEIVLSEQSRLGNCEMEGVILKDYVSQSFAKYLHPKHTEIRAQAKTLEGKYVNSPRVYKAVRRLQDRGIKKPSIDDVVFEVSSDVKAETGLDFENDAVRSVICSRELYRRD